MSGFELYVPSTERWRGVFKKTGVPVPSETKVDVQTGGKASSVKLVTPSQQMIQAAEKELKSPLHHDQEGMLQSESPSRRVRSPAKKVKPAGAIKKKPARKQVRSAPAAKKTGAKKSTAAKKKTPAKKKK